MKSSKDTQTDTLDWETGTINLENVTEIITALMGDDLSDDDRSFLQDKLFTLADDQELTRIVINLIANELTNNKYKEEGRTPTLEEQQRFQAISDYINKGKQAEAPKTDKKKIPLVRRRNAWQAAAVLIPFFAVAGAYLGGKYAGGDSDAMIAEHVLETCEYVQKDITLADNSKVWVNSDSRISYPEEFGKKRQVDLEGEAYFKVEPDDKPFIVHAGELDVSVLGTEFDIRAYPGEQSTEVFLDKGKVEVSVGRRKTKLTPGQKLTYNHVTDEVVVELSGKRKDWRSDVIDANGRTLEELFRMIGNYYDKQIIFDNTTLDDDNLFATKFGKDRTAEQVISSLATLTGKFDYYVDNDTIYINNKQKDTPTP